MAPVRQGRDRLEVVRVSNVIATAALCTVRCAAMLSCGHVDMQPSSASDASKVTIAQ